MPAKKELSGSPHTQQSYKVFVSSTYRDNENRRRIVQEAIAMAGMVWHGMEIFTAGTRPTVAECRRFAGEADVLVGIIAWRYGWEPEGQDRSITELEYEASEERLMFLIDPSLPVNPETDFDPMPERWQKQERLEKFKAHFSADQMPTLFKETTLQAKVLAALNQWRERRERAFEKEVTGPENKPAEPTEPKLTAEIRSYCQKAESLHANLPVAGFVTQLKVPRCRRHLRAAAGHGGPQRPGRRAVCRCGPCG